MDKELESLLKEAHGQGASEADLDMIVNAYQSKKKSKADGVSLPSYSNPFAKTDTSKPAVLTSKGKSEYDQRLEEESKREAELNKRANEAFNVYRQVQGDDVADSIQSSVEAKHKDTLSSEYKRSGNRAGYIYNELLSGVGDIAAGIGDVSVQNTVSNPFIAAGNAIVNTKTRNTGDSVRDYFGMITDGLLNIVNNLNPSSEVNSPYVKNYRENVSPEISGFLKKKIGADVDSGTEAKYQNEFITSAIGGLSRSTPAMLTGGAGLMIQGYASALNSVQQADTDNSLDEGTKTIYAGTVGLVNASLEKFGLDRIFKGSTPNVARAITEKAITEASKETGGKITGNVLMRIINGNINGLADNYSKFGIKALHGVLTEGWTGGAQEVNNVISEKLLNASTGKSIFDTEDESTWEGFKNTLARIGYASAQEAVGGGILGTISSVRYLSPKRKSAVISAESKLGKINEEIDNPYISETTREVLVQKKITLQNNIDNEVRTGDAERSKFTPEEKAHVELLSDEAAKLETALLDSSLPDGVKEELQADLEAKNSEIESIYEDASKRGEDSRKKQTPLEKIDEDIQALKELIAKPNQSENSREVNQIILEDALKQREQLVNEGGQYGAKEVNTEVAEPVQAVEANQAADNKRVSAIGSESVNDTKSGIKNNINGEITPEQVQNQESVAKTDNISDSNVHENEVFTKNEQSVSGEQMTAEPEIVGEVKTASTERIKAIRAKRAELMKRIGQKAAQLNAGFNPDIISDLVELGSTYIEEGIVRFKDFSDNLKRDFGKNIPDTVLREVYKQSAEANGLGVRGFTESIDESHLSKETKQAKDESDYSLYNKQSHEELAEKAEQKNDSELEASVKVLERLAGDLKTDDNSYVTDAIELLNRYDKAGDTDNANRIAYALSKNATVVAQTLAQYRQLRKATKEGYLRFVEKMLNKNGRELTAKHKEKISALYTAQQTLTGELETALDDYYNKLDKQSRKDYYSKLWAQEQALRDLDNYIESLMPRDLASTIVTIQKGSLLTIKSLIANPFYNVFYAPIRFARGEIANFSDRLLANIFKTNRTKITSVSGESMSLALQSISVGAKRALRTAVKGGVSTDLSKFDIDRRLKPFEAWKRLLGAGDREIDRTVKDKISDILEGTIGLPANLTLRMLPFGDMPFNELAKNQRLLEIGKTKGLKGDDLKRFLIKPDKESLRSAEEYGNISTFQDDNLLSKGAKFAMRSVEQSANKIHPSLGAMMKIFLNSAAPYIKTPSSVASKVFKYATPIVPFINMSYGMSRFSTALNAFKTKPSEANRKQLEKAQRELTEHQADFAITLALTFAAQRIVANGLVSGSAPEEEERKKEKDFMFITQPPNTLNISGLIRMMPGGDPSFQQGDVVVSTAILGVFGAVLGIVNDTKGEKLRESIKKSKKKGLNGESYYSNDGNLIEQLFSEYILGSFENATAGVKYMTDQSFLQGVDSFMQAIAKQDFGNMGTQLYKTILSIPVPNSFVQVNKAWRQYLKDPYTENDLQTFANIAKERSGYDVESLPNRLNIWGEDVKQTPDGSSQFVYQVLDPFKTQTILDDPISFKLFDIQRKTNDNSVIPSPVQREISMRGERITLTKEEHLELVKLVGSERKKLADKVLSRYEVNSSNPEDFIPRLQKAYEAGYKHGRFLFIKANQSKKKWREIN